MISHLGRQRSPVGETSLIDFCPYLGSRRERDNVYTIPAQEHRCYTARGPNTLELGYQEHYCLAAAHRECPFYVPQDAMTEQRTSVLRAIVLGLLLMVCIGAALVAFGSANKTANSLLAVKENPGPTELAARKYTPTSALRMRTQVPFAPSLTKAVGVEGVTATVEAIGASPTLTPTPLPSKDATRLPSRTPTNQPTPSPAETATPSSVQTIKPTAIVTRSPSSQSIPVGPSPTQPNSQVYPTPILLDPPSGSILSRNTILRWSSEQVLKSDEVFDVLVWPEGNPQQSSIGSTSERIFSIDFKVWGYPDSGKFFWTVRIKRTDGTLLSSTSEPFFFSVTRIENAPPSAPLAPQPTQQKPEEKTPIPPPPK